jgi:hypothetical protein
MRGARFDTFEELQEYLREYVIEDLARRHDDRFSADLGAFYALLSCYGQMPSLVASGQLTAESRMSGPESWWIGFFSYFASGPPGERLEQLLALHRAGLLRFLGPDMWVREQDGRFVAGGSATGHTVTANALLEARLPKATVLGAEHDLLRSLAAAGDLVEETLTGSDGQPVRTGLLLVTPGEGQLIDANGQEHPRRFALGPNTTTRTAAAFARPRTNAGAFRYNDLSARAVLRLLRSLDPAAGHQ